MSDTVKPVENIDEVIETVVPGLSQDEYEKIRNDALEKAKTTRHTWVMKGRGVLACLGCPYPHRVYIDPSKKLTGIDSDGLPILS